MITRTAMIRAASFALIVQLGACGPSDADALRAERTGLSGALADLAGPTNTTSTVPESPVAFEQTTASAVQEAAAATLSAAEGEIEAAVEAARPGGDTAALDAIIARLNQLDVEATPSLAYYRTYWLAYANYQMSIALQRAGRARDPEPSLRRAISLLEDIQPSDSDAQALYAMAVGLNLQFVPRENIMAEIPKVSRALARSLSLNPENPRALYANAISDQNTPEAYGGGQRAEGYARQCLALRPPAGRTLAPDWGQDLCAALLAEILLEDDRREDATDILNDARRRWPASAALSELARRF